MIRIWRLRATVAAFGNLTDRAVRLRDRLYRHPWQDNITGRHSM